MDKQTLSNYGWLVIVTLILAVMLALATPFGTYVGDAVVSVANGFVGASDAAIDEDNIKTNEDKWDSKFDYNTFKKAGATFSDGTFLTWKELQLAENGTKYGYDASKISDNEIKTSAFRYCTTIVSIVIPNDMPNIGQMAFQGCSLLVDVTIPDSMTCIGEATFADCTSLVAIDVGNGVTSIREAAFSGCTALTTITISSNFSHTQGSPFVECSSLNTIVFKGTKSQWNNNIHISGATVRCTDGNITLS